MEKYIVGKEIFDALKIASAFIPTPIYWEDVNSIIIGANIHVLPAVGLKSLDDYIGKSLYQLYPKEMADNIKMHNEKVMRSGKVSSQEEAIKDIATGKIKYYTAIKAPLYDSYGKIIGIIGTSVDITDRKNMEEDLKKAKIAAEAANIAKTEFIANMSHDIRTPLSGVVGLGELVEKELDNPKHKAMVHDIVKSSDELLNMLNEILDVISLDHITTNDIHEEPFDLSHLIQTIIDLEQSSSDLKKIQLLTSIDKHIPPVLLGDHKKLHHIVLNLVGNAIKFTQNGHVHINVQLLQKNTSTAQLLFEITDTGTGIPSESLERVFELFYRVTPSYKSLDKGHGLGLHIVKTYVELLGGHVSVESKINQGSKFSFSLSFKIPEKNTKPLNLTSSITHSEPVNQAEPLLKEPIPAISPNAPQILIIEDNDVVRMVTENIVSSAHCNPITANNAETALDLAKKHPFDLILSDIGLPGLSGIEFAKQFRLFEKENHKKPVPIVAVTGHGQTILKDAHQAGFNHLIIKPLKPEVFQDLCTQFALFDAQTPCNTTTLQPPPPNQSPLGPDLPNSEAELFSIDSLPLFDPDAAKKIIGDQPALLSQMLNLSLKVIQEELPLLKAAYEEKNWQQVAKIAHKLKGGFLNIGLTRAAIASQYLERYHKAGHSTLLPKLFSSLLVVLNDTSTFLRDFAK